MDELTAEAQYVLDAIDRDVARHTLHVESARELILEDLSDSNPEPVADVREYDIVGPDGDRLPLRVYRPNGADDDGPLPVLVFMHGGGWQLGTLDTGAPICRAFSNEGTCLVVAVGYRLAPEHPFPAGLEDVYTAVEWVSDNVADLGGDPERIAVGGTSAGGNLATAVSLLARDRGGPAIAYQLLYAPMLLAPGVDYEFETALAPRSTARRSFSGDATAVWHADHYFARAVDRVNPYGSPLLARDLSDLPPAEVVTAGFDRLRPECREFVHRLRTAGVDVEHTDYEEMPHGFYYLVNDDAVETPRRAIQQSVTRFRSVLTA